MTATLAQTIIMLTMSRGLQLPMSSPAARRGLLQRKWIAPPRPFTLTDAGRAALAASPFLAQAQRALDRPPLRPARTGIGKRR